MTTLILFFSLEYAGELSIIELRRAKYLQDATPVHQTRTDYIHTREKTNNHDQKSTKKTSGGSSLKLRQPPDSCQVPRYQNLYLL